MGNGRVADDAFDEDDDEQIFMNTPLHWSCYKGHMATTLSLLDASYSLQDLDSVGNTPLHLAGASRNLAVVELLLASGADPRACNRYQLTPLDVTTSGPVREVLARAAKQRQREAPYYDAEKEERDKLEREVQRKAQSLSLRSVAGNLAQLMGRPMPTNLEDEQVRIAEIKAARDAAVATNGVVDPGLVAQANEQVKRFELSSYMRRHLAKTAEQHPVVTQRAYGMFVNKLERFVKAGERASVDPLLLGEAKKTIGRAFSEFWLFKIEEELKIIECAAADMQGRLGLLGERIASATAAGASESLVLSSTKVLDRLLSEVDLADKVAKMPPYKMPPPEEETAELNKKQLAAFLAEYWSEDDVGHMKETTAEDGCHPFPLPPGYNKTEDDEEWAANPMKALVNTPEGYIWIPSMALVNLREAAKHLDVALICATNNGAFEPLTTSAKEKLQAIEADIQQLELKDEADMTIAEAAATKASKKMKAALKKKK